MPLARGFARGTPRPSVTARADHGACSQPSLAVTAAPTATFFPPETTSIWLTARHALPSTTRSIVAVRRT